MRKSLLTLGLLVGSMLTAVGCGSYNGYNNGYYVRTPPPPMRYEVYGAAPGPGYVWTPGYWNYRGNSYAWVGGSWRRPPRAGYRWSPGTWQQHPRNGYRWRDGRWHR